MEGTGWSCRSPESPGVCGRARETQPKCPAGLLLLQITSESSISILILKLSRGSSKEGVYLLPSKRKTKISGFLTTLIRFFILFPDTLEGTH